MHPWLIRSVWFTMTSNENDNKILDGERIYLRPLDKGDLKYIKKWGNDAEILSLIGEVKPMTQGDVEAFFEKVQNDKNRDWFTIVLKENNRVIGEAGLLRMFKPWRTTDMTIIIGEKDVWGKGYGTETIHLLMEYAFKQLNFHRISIGVVDFNERAIRFWEKVGFKKEGVQRDGYFFNDKYYDFVMMSILEDEYG